MPTLACLCGNLCYQRGPDVEFFEHLQTAIEVALAGHAFALVICNLTKTPKDDEALAAVYKVVEVIAGIVTPRAKK